MKIVAYVSEYQANYTSLKIELYNNKKIKNLL